MEGPWLRFLLRRLCDDDELGVTKRGKRLLLPGWSEDIVRRKNTLLQYFSDSITIYVMRILSMNVNICLPKGGCRHTYKSAPSNKSLLL